MLKILNGLIPRLALLTAKTQESVHETNKTAIENLPATETSLYNGTNKFVYILVDTRNCRAT